MKLITEAPDSLSIFCIVKASFSFLTKCKGEVRGERKEYLSLCYAGMYKGWKSSGCEMHSTVQCAISIPTSLSGHKFTQLDCIFSSANPVYSHSHSC